jgi:hypothetical protein
VTQIAKRTVGLHRTPVRLILGLTMGLLGLWQCTPFGGADAEPPPDVAPVTQKPTIRLTVQVELPITANPLPRRLLVGIVVDTMVYPAEEWLVTDALLQSDTVVRLSHTWSEVEASRVLTVRMRGNDGETWVVGATWEGRTPKARDTAITLELKPVYDGFYSPFDTLPRLNGLRRLAFSLATPPVDDSLFRLSLPAPDFLDSATTAKFPSAIHLIMRHDSLFAADAYRETHLDPRLPDSGLGTCRLLPLTLGSRGGYQSLLSPPDLYSRWKEDSATTSQRIEDGRWWLIREEDNLYLLHAVFIQTVTGEQRWEWYGRN